MQAIKSRSQFLSKRLTNYQYSDICMTYTTWDNTSIKGEFIIGIISKRTCLISTWRHRPHLHSLEPRDYKHQHLHQPSPLNPLGTHIPGQYLVSVTSLETLSHICNYRTSIGVMIIVRYYFDRPIFAR